MTLTTTHSVEKGIYRLLNAPRDLKVYENWQETTISLTESSDLHRAAFAKYLENMALIYDFACKWWEASLEGVIDENEVSREKAVEILITRRVAGPAALPDVIWLVRTYWLQCTEINKVVPEQQRVSPEIFLLQWLIDKNENKWIELLTCMPYWPVGIDHEGNWV